MKFIIAIAVVLGIAAIAQAMSEEDKNSIKAKLGAECKAKEGASDADMAALAKHEDPPSKEGKCVVACVLETIGVVEGNKHILEGSIAVTKMAHPDDEKAIEATKKIHTDCEAVSDSDRCEYAIKLMKCTMDSLVKQGFDPKEVL